MKMDQTENMGIISCPPLSTPLTPPGGRTDKGLHFSQILSLCQLAENLGVFGLKVSNFTPYFSA